MVIHLLLVSMDSCALIYTFVIYLTGFYSLVQIRMDDTGLESRYRDLSKVQMLQKWLFQRLMSVLHLLNSLYPMTLVPYCQSRSTGKIQLERISFQGNTRIPNSVVMRSIII